MAGIKATAFPQENDYRGINGLGRLLDLFDLLPKKAELRFMTEQVGVESQEARRQEQTALLQKRRDVITS